MTKEKIKIRDKLERFLNTVLSWEVAMSMSKSLTSNTELIKITNGLGLGVNYDLLEELEAKNPYRAEGLQENGLALPESFLGNTFAMLVADNIDLQEQTLSGKCS